MPDESMDDENILNCDLEGKQHTGGTTRIIRFLEKIKLILFAYEVVMKKSMSH